MIKILIAFDDVDIVLGNYFNENKIRISDIFNDTFNDKGRICLFDNSMCVENTISDILPNENSNPFVFVAYTHGNEDSLYCNHLPFVSDKNSNLLKNSLFYSTACKIGINLGHNLIINGCFTFVGFDDLSWVFNDPANWKINIDCDNYALILFLTKDIEIKEAVNLSKSYHENRIDYLRQIGENPLYMTALNKNKNALICLGNQNLMRSDLFFAV